MQRSFLSRVFGFLTAQKRQVSAIAMPIDVLTSALQLHHSMLCYMEDGLDSTGRGFFTWFSQPDFKSSLDTIDPSLVRLTLAYQMPAEWKVEDTPIASMKRLAHNPATDAAFLTVDVKKEDNGYLSYDAYGSKGDQVIVRCKSYDIEDASRAIFDFAQIVAPEIIHKSRQLYAKYEARIASMEPPRL